MREGEPSVTVTTTSVAVANEDVSWDDFDSDFYYRHNYDKLRDDDSRIIKIVADFFERARPRRWPSMAIDVGSGTNLYPALTMLPYSSRVSLIEPAFNNRQWLSDALHAPQESWDDFWTAIADGRPEYKIFANPFDVLADRAVVRKGNVFSLEPDLFDIGTMFFVAESITTRDDEFRRATRQFVRSLKPWAPFAAAFMRDSAGYLVGERFFPACSVDEKDIEACLAPVARIDQIKTVDSHDLRDGYCGMIVATGWKR